MSSNSIWARIWKKRQIYLFISPFFILFGIFQLTPMVWSFYLSFHEWNGLGAPEFIGLGNYRFLLRDKVFHSALRNTVIYWLANSLAIIPLALILASLLNHTWLRAKRLIRTTVFLPYVTATVAVGLIFNMLFDYNSGLINSLLELIGLAPVPWLTSVQTSKLPVIFLNIWRITPWHALILFSGLQAIPHDLYEAATVDGAGALRRFFSITIPSLMPILFFSFITLTVDAFRIFTEPYILTQGGPANSSISIVQYLYINGFSIFKLGLASAVGYALTLILLIVSFGQIIAMRRESGLMEGN
ncbi:MAG: sugar ABC transporter permease [Caldilineaceae bacterium]|nr:sugar ABC transporter permease [Caldilineaceae bacterium]